MTTEKELEIFSISQKLKALDAKITADYIAGGLMLLVLLFSLLQLHSLILPIFKGAFGWTAAAAVVAMLVCAYRILTNKTDIKALKKKRKFLTYGDCSDSLQHEKS